MESWKQSTRNHWNAVGEGYNASWSGRGKELLSEQETSYIASIARTYTPTSVLDIGCGTGRILDIYTHIPSIQEIYGTDLSETMVNHCIKRFQHENRVRHIAHGDMEEAQPYQEKKFDMISAIRVLKYNASWRDMIGHMHSMLNPNGILICTLPNIHSITAFMPDTFSHAKIPIQYTTPREFKTLLQTTGFNVIDMRGFSKLPDVLHTFARSTIAAQLVTGAERALDVAMGPIAGSRILFATCQRHD